MESVGNTVIMVLDASSSSNLANLTPHIFDGTPQDTTGYSSVRTLIVGTHEGLVSTLFSIDSTTWDVSLTEKYKPPDPLYLHTPIQARYVKTVFTNTDAALNSIRLQTILNSDGDPGSRSPDVSTVTISADKININILSQDAPVSVSANILNRVDVNIAQSIPLEVSAHVLDQPIDINFFSQSASVDVNIASQTEVIEVKVTEPIFGDVSAYVRNTVQVNIDSQSVPLDVRMAPAENVWQSYSLVGTPVLLPDSAGTVLYTIDAVNEAPDARYLKIYDAQSVNPLIQSPRYTLPLLSNTYVEKVFPVGVRFRQGIMVRVTRCVYDDDLNEGLPGDVQVNITYT